MIELHGQITGRLKRIYSTLPSFDDLQILSFSSGSVIVNFQMSINSQVSNADLARLSQMLQSNLTAVITLTTTGIIKLQMPQNPVLYNSAQEINCTSQDDMTLSKWTLTKGSVYTITNGTEANVTTGINSTVLLTKASEIWAGQYTCIFIPNSSNVTIENIASGKLDVALLPVTIDIRSDPQFPDCSITSGKIPVTVFCIIDMSTENYNITWTGKNTEQLNSPTNSSGSNKITYSIYLSVNCKDPTPPAETCNFTNRFPDHKSATINMPVIYANTTVCNADQDWPKAKANYTAQIVCKIGIGYRTRICKPDGSWDVEISNCVNFDLYNLLDASLNVGNGLGYFQDNAQVIFQNLTSSTNNSAAINTYANLNASVTILSNMRNASSTANYILNDSQIQLALTSSSNLLFESLKSSWTATVANTSTNGNLSIAERYLQSVEGLVVLSNVNTTVESTYVYPNIEMQGCKSNGSQCTNTVFNTNVDVKTSSNNTVITVAFKSLDDYLTKQSESSRPNSIVVSTSIGNESTMNKESLHILIDFNLTKARPRNTKMQCVYWDFTTNNWSDEGCTWGGPSNEKNCECNHLTAFTVLVSKTALNIMYLDKITYVGISVSIVSLLSCLLIECIVWSSVVKSNVSYCRHTAHINISLCLLIADCCFLAASFPDKIPNWCQICVVLMHYFYLSMFFWMLCLSVMVLHQMVFLFHQISKKICLGLSFFIGYGCPLLIVFITFITFNNGAANSYYDPATCWLIYAGFLSGSIFAFVLPVGTIVIINVFCMIVVIMRLLRPSLEIHSKDEKEVAKGILKAVVLLTPIFGGTWVLGFFVLLIDLTEGTLAYVVNYAFTLLNAFQGLFILLTTYLGERMVRVEILRYFKIKQKSQSSLSESSSKLASSLKEK
ncbi:hypothetical protein UPYG_G00232510 [Umbra pygmaea]|uniref:Uncharacterized protein n=1 Tax=Umbra pygmaea TaxID=75934 RepID=A0ABD0WDQ4_UMBPY